jgi:hypothetical protein
MPQLLVCNFPPLPEPALPARARPMAVPHLPPPPALLPRGMGQPKPPLFVPHFTLAPPNPAPPAPQPAAAGPQPLPETMRVTCSLQRHNNIRLLPPLTAVYKQFPFMFNQSVASGPLLVSDVYGLPFVRPGCRVPTWIKRCLTSGPSCGPARPGPGTIASSTLKLLLAVCLIQVLRDPPLHRLLSRPTFYLQDVFSPGPRLRRPPLSSAPTPPWVAPAILLTGSEAPRTDILQPVSRPPLLPLILASLRGAVASPARSSAHSIPPMILLENSWTRHPPLLLVADRAVLVHNLTLLPACHLAAARAVLALKQITSHTST